MLICRVPEEGAGRGEPAENAGSCRAASELFELMTKDHDFEAGDETLTTSDLVLLYKNIDLGNQLMSNVRKRPNQHVESVYHGDPETDSDLSESCSSEELLNIVFANKERINLFTNPTPLNSLCHKLGDLEIQVSNISNDLYGDRRFLNKDLCLREQLHSLQLMSKANEFNTMLPTSLLDFICSNRLEDNFNFYLDDVITHVKHTIDQLKRISNGDYLPQNVKEKWRELDPQRMEHAPKVLTASMSMPLQVKRKDRMTTVWDNVVNTEIDFRSLLKIMQKKIVFEVPRMIGGPYRIFSRCCTDKLVISCARRARPAKRRCTRESSQEPRVDAVLSVRCTPVDQLISEVHSFVVLPPEHQIIEEDCSTIMPLEYNNPELTDQLIPEVIEIHETEQNIDDKPSHKSDEFFSFCSLSDTADSINGDRKSKDDTDSSSSVSGPGSPLRMEQILSSATRVVRAEISNHATPNDLYFSMSTLNRQTSLPETSSSNTFYIKTKKKSPERVRIKSPYENKSYILEERKRRKLLEVKERRERRQIYEKSKALKSRDFPQKVSSVTKLSITNKSFYNSIYGRNTIIENTKRMSPVTNINIKARKGTQKIDEELEESEADVETGITQSDKSVKIKCRGNFLEDTETEMSYLKSKQDSDFLPTPTTTSVGSNDSTANLYPQSTNYCSLQESTITIEKQRLEHEVEILNALEVLKTDTSISTKVDDDNAPAVECRRSIEKICTLVKKLQRIEISETAKKKAIASEPRSFISESGSSLRRRVSFSNPKMENDIKEESQNEIDKDLLTAAVPKVVISAKLKPVKVDERSRSKTKPRVKTVPENPLKAVSQLLHKFDSVLKSRPKIADPKSINRSMTTENAELDGKIQKRRSRIESPVREDPKVSKAKTRFVRDGPDVKPQVLEKKINDLTDEEKEARGEAVRGPPRFSSRLHALAQPRRAYVQALAEDFPKRQTPARPPRPAPQPHLARARTRVDGRLSPDSVRVPQSSLECAAKPRRSATGNPRHRARDSPQLAAFAAAAADALHTLKKRVGVEPVLGRLRAEPAPAPACTRAPLLPDGVLSSSGSSTGIEDDHPSTVGLQLHRMVSAILRADQSLQASGDTQRDPSPPPAATVVVEPIQTQNVIEEIFEKTAQETNEPTDENAKRDVVPVNSVTELEKLEHALHHSLSSGAFVGRLRVNKLTLSPRPSLQRVVMHQSGDTTLILNHRRSNSMQKIQFTCNPKINLMGVLSKSGLGYGFSKFPLQMPTVGYAFPVSEYKLKKTPGILNRDIGTSAAEMTRTNGEEHFSAPTVINDAEGNTDYNGLSDKKCAIGQACASYKNKETDMSSGSTKTISNDNTEDTASVNKESPSDYNTSFNILVGLLNEIQNITTCGSDAASSQTKESVSWESNQRKGRANMSSTSWITVSNSYMSSETQLGTAIPEMNSVSAETEELKPSCEDKEVLARVTSECAAASTSRQAGLEVGVETSTCTTLPTSRCSVSAFTHAEYCDIGCNTNKTSVKSLVPYYDNIFKVDTKNDAILSPGKSVDTGNKRNVGAVRNILEDIAPVQKNKRILNLIEEVRNDKKEVNTFCLNVGEFDSTLKVKRDILVTFYSILVLTVFAALAFPDMLHYAH